MAISKEAQAVLKAQTAADLVDSLARLLWAKDNPGKDCPPDRIPTPETLAAWLPEFPEAAHLEAGERLAALYGLSDGGGCRWKLGRTVMGKTWRYIGEGVSEEVPNPTGIPVGTQSLTLNAWERPGPDGLGWGSMGTLEKVHEVWLATPDEHRPKHPLAPLVQAWQRRPQPSEPFKPVNRASLPQLHRVTAPEGERLQAAELPAIYGGETEPPKLWLPGMEPEISGCPSWLLALFDSVGGKSMQQGRGAPWTMRLFVGALLHLGIPERDGEWHNLRFELAEVEAWLHPDGWDRANRRRDWYKLPEALRAINNLAWVYIPGVGDVLMAAASVIPTSPTDPGVEFTIRLPRSAAHGARIDWPTLCNYGKESAVLYRAYLSIVALMDRTAYKGAPITKQIGTPILKADGQPKRKHGGRIVRSAAALIPHPNAGMVQALTDADLARLIGLGPAVRVNLTRARRAFERLAADGIIDTERTKDGKLRTFGPARES